MMHRGSGPPLADRERAHTFCFKGVRRGVACQAAAAAIVQAPVIVAVTSRCAIVLRRWRRLRSWLLAYKVDVVQLLVVIRAAGRQPLVQLGLALQRAAARLQLGVGRLRAAAYFVSTQAVREQLGLLCVLDCCALC